MSQLHSFKSLIKRTSVGMRVMVASSFCTLLSLHTRNSSRELQFLRSCHFRKGENIHQIQSESGCRVVVGKEDMLIEDGTRHGRRSTHILACRLNRFALPAVQE